METKALLALFEGPDREAGESLLEAKLDSLHLGMTPFQILHFVLNRREYPTDYARFQQVKLELWTRIQTLMDLHFQLRKAQAEIKLGEAELDHLAGQPEGKAKEAALELKQVDIDRATFQMASIRVQAADKLREAVVFLGEYQQLLPQFKDKGPEALAEAEVEGWRIKSAYYPELGQRYGLTPLGFLKLPHEEGGLNALIEAQRQLQTEPGRSMHAEPGRSLQAAPGKNSQKRRRHGNRH